MTLSVGGVRPCITTRSAGHGAVLRDHEEGRRAIAGGRPDTPSPPSSQTAFAYGGQRLLSRYGQRRHHGRYSTPAGRRITPLSLRRPHACRLYLAAHAVRYSNTITRRCSSSPTNSGT